MRTSRAAVRRVTAAALAAALTGSATAGALAASPAAAAAAGGRTELVSLPDVTDVEGAANGTPAVSAGGRYVAFTSRAALVPGDDNGRPDVYVRDRRQDRTVRVSVPVAGADGQGRRYSLNPSISDDGRYVAFVSNQTLLPGAQDGGRHVYVRDLVARKTTAVDVTPSGAVGDRSADLEVDISSDGRFVAFSSAAGDLVPGAPEVGGAYLRDLATGTTTLVSEPGTGGVANRPSTRPTVSADGSVVAFASLADLIPGDTNNGKSDVFVRDLRARTTSRVSTAVPTATGKPAAYTPDISDDGRYVTFEAYGAFASGDFNYALDVYLVDRATGSTTLVSTTPSGDGSTGSSYQARISGDGRSVVWISYAQDLVPSPPGGSRHVYVRDLASGTTTLQDRSTDGAVGNGDGDFAGISTDGRFVAINSVAANLDGDLDGDARRDRDVFLRERPAP